MGRDVTLEKVKATRVLLETRVMDVQATNRTLTSRSTTATTAPSSATSMRCGRARPSRATSVPIPRNRPGRRHPCQRPQERGPSGQGRDAARGSVRWDDCRGRRVLPIPGARGAGRPDAGHGRGAAARCRAAVERRHPVGRGGVLPPEQHPTLAQDGRRQSGVLLPGDCSVTRELLVETRIAGGGLDSDSVSLTPSPHTP